MKIALISDLHLSYRQYGLKERERDYYEQYHKIVNEILKHDEIKYIIVAGDIFDGHNPVNKALYEFEQGLNKLTENGRHIIGLHGNHDIAQTDTFQDPLTIFLNKYNLKLIDDDYVVIDNIFIGGVRAKSATQKDELLAEMNRLAELAHNYDRSLLVLHQGLNEFMMFGADLEINDIPKEFNLCLLGHLHGTYRRDNVYYPGSTEIHSFNEVKDYYENGKGFSILDTDNWSIERINIPLNREFYDIKINYDNIEEGIDNLKDRIVNDKNKPIVRVEIIGENIDNSIVTELIHDELSKITLKTQIKINSTDTLEEEIDLENTNDLSAESMLIEKTKHMDKKDQVFALELLKKASAKAPDLGEFADDYFNRRDTNGDS